MKKFLICGLGSIGQRHIRMIQTVTNGQAVIGAFRSRKLDIVISDKLEATLGQNPETHYGIESFTDWHAAMAWKPDAVFVTNPIAMHVDTAIRAAEAGCHIFIEKPLDCDNKNVPQLAALVKEKKLTCMVGYQQRYHPGYAQVREILQSGVLGSIVSANLHFGEWLPGMHPYEDYRESHAARADQGGGVILCLSHEIDMAYWLFGMPTRVYATGGQLSNLEMDVEDTAEILLTCGHPVHVHLDFLQKPARRYIHIVGDRGKLLFDAITNRLELYVTGSEPQVMLFDTFQRNDMFLAEVSDFIAAAQQGIAPPISLEEGAAVLEICLAAKQSLHEGRAVDLHAKSEAA